MSPIINVQTFLISISHQKPRNLDPFFILISLPKIFCIFKMKRRREQLSEEEEEQLSEEEEEEVEERKASPLKKPKKRVEKKDDFWSKYSSILE